MDLSGQALTKIPNHVAIIMDGNSRWAVQRDLNYIEGHKEALTRIKELVEYSGEIGIKHVTFWAWSTKNWKRSPDFISAIMQLFRDELKPDGIFAEAIDKGAEIRHIGDLGRFPKDISSKVIEYLQRKPDNPKLIVNLAVGYEGRDEIVRAIKKMIEDGVTESDVTPERINSYLDTAGQPDVDLLIRTGGEKRTSAYLIWQAADAEYYFTDTYMPDFNVTEYQKALGDYASRERRMGGQSKFY